MYWQKKLLYILAFSTSLVYAENKAVLRVSSRQKKKEKISSFENDAQRLTLKYGEKKDVKATPTTCQRVYLFFTNIHIRRPRLIRMRCMLVSLLLKHTVLPFRCSVPQHREPHHLLLAVPLGTALASYTAAGPAVEDT